MRGLETVEFACGLPVHLAGLNTPNVSTKVDAHTLRQPLGVAAGITPFNFPVDGPDVDLPDRADDRATPSSGSPPPTPRAPRSSRPSCGRRPGFPTASSTSSTAAARRSTRSSSTPASTPSSSSAPPPVGRYVYETGTQHGKRVGAYTGAKNAMLVLPDADMELVADAAVAAGFGSAGERCMAQTLVITVGDAADRLRPMIVERMAKLKIGPGMEPGVDMGPIYSAEHRASIIEWIDKGVAEGAELVVDGRSFRHPEHPDGFFLGVTLFDHVTPEMEIYHEEIFGPVLGIVRAETFDEALGLINAHQYGNGTAIFTTDGGAARRFEIEVDVPMIGINVPIPVPAGYLSFGGTRGSAFADLQMRGEDSVRFFTKQKEVTVRWPEPGKRGALSLVFPGN